MKLDLLTLVWEEMVRVRTSNIQDVHLQQLYEKLGISLNLKDYLAAKLVIQEFQHREKESLEIIICTQELNLVIWTPYGQIQISPEILTELNLKIVYTEPKNCPDGHLQTMVS